MSTLTEIEDAVVRLPPAQQHELHSFLSARLQGQMGRIEIATRISHSVLEISSVSVGEVLQPVLPGDDLFGEMLENRA